MLDLSPGTVLENRYEILHLLGRGGMGAVYLALDRRLNQRCAVKMSLRTDPEAAAQFQREAGFLAGLHHPNLPRVTDYFAQDNRYFLVMDYVRGQNFDQIVHLDGTLPESVVLRWLPQILDALEYLHSQQPQPIIHRDIRPANLKLTPSGRVILVDFGIAKRHDPQMSTVVGARAVSPGYSPPEQYGRGRTDVRSDIFSLGATLYYVLTGVAPAEATDRMIGASRLVPPREHNARISPATERAILKAMALNPNQRFASIQEFRQALPAAETAPPAESPGKMRSLVRLGPAMIAMILLLVVGLTAFGAWRFVSGKPPGGSSGGVALPAATTSATATTTPGLNPTLVPAHTMSPVDTIGPTSTLRPTPTRTPALTSQRPVSGSVIIRGGACCAGGTAGGTIDIGVAFEATSPIADVTEMRTTASYGGGCSTEAELVDYPWEPFVSRKTFPVTVAINWIGFYVSVQYRDAEGHLSPVYCDDISVEGMPPPTATEQPVQATVPPPSPTPPVIEVSRTVQGNIEWNDTGILVGAGDAVDIRYISGGWRVGNCEAGDWPLLDADGDPNAPHDQEFWPLPGANLGALLGKIDAGSPMLIGKRRSFTTDTAGHLYLGINDNPVYDNCGSMSVQITVEHR